MYGALQGAVRYIKRAKYALFIASGALQGAVHVAEFILPTVADLAKQHHS